MIADPTLGLSKADASLSGIVAATLWQKSQPSPSHVQDAATTGNAPVLAVSLDDTLPGSTPEATLQETNWYYATTGILPLHRTDCEEQAEGTARPVNYVLRHISLEAACGHRPDRYRLSAEALKEIRVRIDALIKGAGRSRNAIRCRGVEVGFCIRERPAQRRFLQIVIRVVRSFRFLTYRRAGYDREAESCRPDYEHQVGTHGSSKKIF